MGFDCLDRDEQFLGHFLVAVAAGDQAHHFELPRRELVQLVVGDVRGGRAERVQDKACQPGREDRVAAGHAADGAADLRPGNRLGDIAARARPDHGDHVLGRVGDAQRQEPRGAQQRRRAGQHLTPAATAAAGEVDVQQHDVGTLGCDDGDCLFHGAGLTRDDDVRVQVRLQPGTEDGVVVHDHHPDPGRVAG